MSDGGDETDGDKEIAGFLADHFELRDILVAAAALMLDRISAGKYRDVRCEITGLQRDFFRGSLNAYGQRAMLAALQRRRVRFKRKLDKRYGRLRDFAARARYGNRRSTGIESDRRKDEQGSGRGSEHQRRLATNCYLIGVGVTAEALAEDLKAIRQRREARRGGYF